MEQATPYYAWRDIFSQFSISALDTICGATPARAGSLAMIGIAPARTAAQRGIAAGAARNRSHCPAKYAARKATRDILLRLPSARLISRRCWWCWKMRTGSTGLWAGLAASQRLRAVADAWAAPAGRRRRKRCRNAPAAGSSSCLRRPGCAYIWKLDPEQARWR
jgi:hypothetical protein